MYRAVLVVLLLVLAGCQTPGASVGTETPVGADTSAAEGANASAVPGADARESQVGDAGGDGESGDGAGGEESAGSDAVPDDPSEDRLGWEDGYWHNESVDVTTEDGLDADELEAVVARAMARIEAVRGLEFEESVDVRVIDRATYRNGTTGNHSAALQRFDDAKFEALFLVGEDEGSIEAQSETRGESVLGYYAPARDAIVVVSDDETPTLDGEATLAHELVHALQDQHFDLENGTAATRDAHQGRTGLIEGDATVVQRRYEDRCVRDWDCLGRAEGGGGEGSGGEGSGGGNVHFGIQFLLYFPYGDGAAFVDHRREAGGWAAVNDAYESYPDGSPEVIYPERYDEWEPADVDLPDRSTDEWDRVRPPGRPDHAVPGQSAIAASLAYTLVDGHNDSAVVRPAAVINYRTDGSVDREDPFDYDVAAARGWAGGRMHVYERGPETAFTWRTRWESERDAREFARGWGALIDHWGGERVDDGAGAGDARPVDAEWVIDDGPFADAFAVRQDGRTVTVVNAPERGDLEAVHGA